jgi:WD40 repeat protein
MDDDSIRIWNLENGEMHLGVPDLKGRSDSVVFSPDSQFLAGTTAYGQIVLVKVKTKEIYRLQEEVSEGGFTSSLAFSPDGWTLAGGTHSLGDIRFWDMEGKELKKTWAAPPPLDKGGITSIAYSPDGKVLGVCNGFNRRGPVELRNAQTGEVLTTLQENVKAGSMAFAPNGKALVVGDQYAESSNPLTLWDLP